MDKNKIIKLFASPSKEDVNIALELVLTKKFEELKEIFGQGIVTKDEKAYHNVIIFPLNSKHYAARHRVYGYMDYNVYIKKEVIKICKRDIILKL
jgi:hypothetical protein